MAKKSFILYHDQKEVIDELDDEQAGKLFKAIYEYNVNKKNTLKGMLKLVFIPFKATFDRDEIKWEEISKKRSQAGKKGMKTRWKDNENITNDNKSYQKITSITVSGSVNDNVSDNVSESVSVNNITPPTPTLPEILFFCQQNGMVDFDCENFFEYYEANGWTDKNGNKIQKWQAKLKSWYKKDLKEGKIRKEDTSRRLE